AGACPRDRIASPLATRGGSLSPAPPEPVPGPGPARLGVGPRPAGASPAPRRGAIPREAGSCRYRGAAIRADSGGSVASSHLPILRSPSGKTRPLRPLGSGGPGRAGAAIRPGQGRAAPGLAVPALLDSGRGNP